MSAVSSSDSVPSFRINSDTLPCKKDALNGLEAQVTRAKEALALAEKIHAQAKKEHGEKSKTAIQTLKRVEDARKTLDKLQTELQEKRAEQKKNCGEVAGPAPEKAPPPKRPAKPAPVKPESVKQEPVKEYLYELKSLPLERFEWKGSYLFQERATVFKKHCDLKKFLEEFEKDPKKREKILEYLKQPRGEMLLKLFQSEKAVPPPETSKPGETPTEPTNPKPAETPDPKKPPPNTPPTANK
jgi:hypothetical protein